MNAVGAQALTLDSHPLPAPACAATRQCDHPQGWPPAAALPVRRQLHLHQQCRARVSVAGSQLGLLQRRCAWGLTMGAATCLDWLPPACIASALAERRHRHSAPALLFCSCKAGMFEVMVVARPTRCAPAGDPGDYGTAHAWARQRTACGIAMPCLFPCTSCPAALATGCRVDTTNTSCFCNRLAGLFPVVLGGCSRAYVCTGIAGISAQVVAGAVQIS